VSPVKYELGFYIPGDDILHSHRSETLKSYINLSTLEPAELGKTMKTYGGVDIYIYISTCS
jgi:hypothetical protein